MTQVGDRVEFLGWGKHDPYTDLEVGTLGTVTFVDGQGTIHVDWDSGGNLGLVTRPFYSGESGFRPDRFRVVERATADGVAAPESVEA